MCCIPLGRGQQSGWRWGGRSVFNEAGEVGVNRTGTVSRPSGTFTWKTSRRDEGPCFPRARWGNPMDTVRCSRDRFPSASGGGFSRGAVPGPDQGGWRRFPGSPGSSLGSEEAALIPSLILDLFRAFSFLNHWSAAVFSHKASVHKLNQAHICGLETIQEQSLTHQGRA